MSDKLKIKMYAFTVDCKEPYELAKFYADLLKWEIVFNDRWLLLAWALLERNKARIPG